MSGKFRNERHRRKVMREMRLAGYSLPENPSRRVNRSYKSPKHNSKVATSKKIHTSSQLEKRRGDYQLEKHMAEENYPYDGTKEDKRIAKEMWAEKQSEYTKAEMQNPHHITIVPQDVRFIGYKDPEKSADAYQRIWERMKQTKKGEAEWTRGKNGPGNYPTAKMIRAEIKRYESEKAKKK
jgi:hypothetical protein